MMHHNGATRSEIPLRSSLNGARLQGIIGPVFLLSPLALFALAFPLGRQLLITFLFFFLPYLSNIGTRFLIPLLPFLCLALCMVLESWRGCLAPVLVLHFFLSWPRVVRIYAPGTMGLDTPRWDETLGEIPKEQVLTARLAGYGIAHYMDQHCHCQPVFSNLAACQERICGSKIDDAYEGRKTKRLFI